MSPKKILAWTASWKGRGVYADGRKIVIPAELDGDPEKLVTVSVPLSKVEVLVNSLYRAMRKGMQEQARYGRPSEVEIHEEAPTPPPGANFEFSAFLSWLADEQRRYMEHRIKDEEENLHHQEENPYENHSPKPRRAES